MITAPEVCSAGKWEGGVFRFQEQGFLKVVFHHICLPFGQEFSVFNVILLMSF